MARVTNTGNQGCETCNLCSKVILHAVSASFTFTNFQDNLAPKGVYRNSVIQNAKKKMSIFTWDWHMVIPDTIIVPVAMVICVSIVIPVSMVTCFQGSLLARRVP